MEDIDFLLPDVIERIVFHSSIDVVIALGTLSKRWREVVHSRTLWRGFDSQKIFCLPRTLIPSAYIAAILTTWDTPNNGSAQEAILSIKTANLVSEADPVKQLEELYTLSQLSDSYPVHITFIIDNNRHLINGAKGVRPTLLKLIARLVINAPVPCIKILVDFLMPHLDQLLVSMAGQYDLQLFIVIIEFVQLITSCLKHAAIRRQYLKEFLNRGLVKKIIGYIGLHGMGNASSDLLEQILQDADQHASDILPAVDIITQLYNSYEYNGFLLLIRSTNVQIWKEICTSLEKHTKALSMIRTSAKTMAVVHKALAVVFEKDLQAFVQLSQWPGARDLIIESIKYLTKSMLSSSMKDLHQFIKTKLEKCEGWIRITYIQSLLDNKVVGLILGPKPDGDSAFGVLCFILTNASPEQDAILKKYDVLQLIGQKLRSQNSDEKAEARKIIDVLSKKHAFAALVVEQIRNKTIRL